MDIKNANRMNFSFAISITLLVINLLGLCPSCLGQNDSCINIYTFENDLTTPNSTCGDGWTLGDLNHTGKKSYMSTQGISKLCINVKGPATIEFWWYSNKIRNNKFLFRIDDKPETESYNSPVWEKRTRTLDEGDHTLSWTFYRGPNDNTSGWIDDLCIRQKSCNEECPTSGVEMKVTPASSQALINATQKSLNVSEEIPALTNTTTYPCPAVYVPIETYSAEEFYVIQGERINNLIFPTITEAINKAPSGSTIKVASGTYKEDISINKSVKLIRLDNSTPVIAATVRGFNIIANDVIIRGFTLESGLVGIKVTSAANCDLSENTINGSKFGIIINSSSNSRIKIFNNTLSNNSEAGIRIHLSSGVNASSNIIDNVGKFAVFIGQSDHNAITNNIIDESDSDGITLNRSSHNIINSNSFKNIECCEMIVKGGTNNTIDSKCRNYTSVFGPGCLRCDGL